MPNGKSPGSDGLSTDFYKFFWPSIGLLVVNSLNCAFQNNSLSKAQSRGIITLICEPDKDPCFVANYRPIPLLNTDYKIVANAVASRLKVIIEHCDCDNQTGFIANKFIGENIGFIREPY